MPLRPLHCSRCGSTRLKYVRVGVDDEVAVCGLCHCVTEFPDEVDDDKANEDLVLHLEQLRLKRPVLEEGGQYEAPRRRRGPSVLMWLMVAIAAMSGLGLLMGRDLILGSTSERLHEDRMLLEAAEPPEPTPERLAEVPSREVEEVPVEALPEVEAATEPAGE